LPSTSCCTAANVIRGSGTIVLSCAGLQANGWHTALAKEFELQLSSTAGATYFHKVVDCQWACPAHTPVPEYIRLIGQGRYTDAYMINWESNVFPGVLGRTCDRPCEPACRRARVEVSGAPAAGGHVAHGQAAGGGTPEPVAICRLKRVAADYKDDIAARLPAPAPSNGKHVACVGAGPASLTVARDLTVLGYSVTVFDGDAKAGGFIRSQIPRFRLPESVIDEETGYILDLGVRFESGVRIDSMRELLARDFDAVFVGCGAPRGRDLDIPGRREAAAGIHVGIDWLASVSFGHITSIGERVVVLGGGNTAMDCCRSARRLGAKDVGVYVRSGFAEMKASPWEKEDAQHEGIPIHDLHVPKCFEHRDGRLTGMRFERVQAVYDAQGRRSLVPIGEPDVVVACDAVLVAVGQENAFPWIERDCGIEFDRHGMPVLDAQTLRSTLANVFFGGDAAFGPKNIITAVAHGHEAAVSIDRLLNHEDPARRPLPMTRLMSQKMGIHEWSYSNDVSVDARSKVPWVAANKALASIRVEVELGFDAATAWKEAERCLNCDVQTVFNRDTCIECDACVDICPMDCITFTSPGDEADLRTRLKAPALNLTQDLYVSTQLKSGRMMVKDEDVCLHCGLCAERCPTGAWDMQKFLLEMTQAGPRCRDGHAAPAARSADLAASDAP
jgi:formate dehydrogenase (NADP+) beta subunit